MASNTYIDMNSEDFERVTEARMLFRRGYAWIDAIGNVGLSINNFPYDKWVTEADEKAHDNFWSYGIHK